MNYLYIAPRKNYPISSALITHILSTYHALPSVEILYTENGKPYVEAPIYFSLSHTESLICLAVSEKEVGVDMERIDRAVDFPVIASRYFPYRSPKTKEEFLELWVQMESAVKFIGGTLAVDGKKCTLEENQVFHPDYPPLFTQRVHHDNHVICLCQADEELFTVSCIV